MNLWGVRIMHPNSVHLQVFPYPHLISVAFPPKRKQSKVVKRTKARKKPKFNKSKQNKNHGRKSLLFLSWLSITSSFLLVSLKASVCHIVHPFVPSATVHCNEPLVWFNASDSWYTILTGYALEFFWGFLFLGDLGGIVPQDLSLHKLQQDPDGVDASVGQPKALPLVGKADF